MARGFERGPAAPQATYVLSEPVLPNPCAYLKLTLSANTNVTPVTAELFLGWLASWPVRFLSGPASDPPPPG